MKKFYLLSVLLLMTKMLVFSQTVALVSNVNSSVTSTSVSNNSSIIEFRVQWLKSDQAEEVKSSDIEENVFGERIAKKMYLFDQTYTYKMAVAPGNPAQRTMFRKPAIYNSVVDIERYLKKEMRKQEMSKEQAENLFNIVLDVALNTYSCETKQLENLISKAKSSVDLLSLFTQNVRIVKEN